LEPQGKYIYSTETRVLWFVQPRLWTRRRTTFITAEGQFLFLIIIDPTQHNTTQHGSFLSVCLVSVMLLLIYRVQKFVPKTRTKSNLCVPWYKIHKWRDRLLLVSTTIVIHTYIHTYMRFKNIYNCSAHHHHNNNNNMSDWVVGN